MPHSYMSQHKWARLAVVVILAAVALILIRLHAAGAV